MNNSAKTLVGFLFAITAWSASAADPLGSQSNPAYSAKQILSTYAGSASGIYYFDPDGVGGATPFAAFADMTSWGGGWIVAHNTNNSQPDLDGNWQSVLGAYGGGTLQIYDNGVLEASFEKSATDSLILLPGQWTYYNGGSFGEYQSVGNLDLGSAYMQSSNMRYSVYFRESVTPAYTAPVPEPETYAMMLAGLGLLGFMARRKKSA